MVVVGPCKHTRREEERGRQAVKETEANRSWDGIDLPEVFVMTVISQGLGRSTTAP